MPDWDRLSEIAARRDVALIEDTAEAVWLAMARSTCGLLWRDVCILVSRVEDVDNWWGGPNRNGTPCEGQEHGWPERTHAMIGQSKLFAAGNQEEVADCAASID
jgi:hypothetical protein